MLQEQSSYDKYTGGVIQAKLKHWKQINGMTNQASGWGGEDDDLFYRLKANKYTPIRRPKPGHGQCTCLNDANHTKRITGNMYSSIIRQIERMKRGSHEWKQDGLNNVDFGIHAHFVDSWGSNWFKVGAPKKHNKIKIFHTFKGRLGNQLFQWASLHGIAHSKNLNLCLQIPSELLQFNGPESCSDSAPKKYISESGYGKYEDFDIKTDTFVNGYLQSFRYFHPNISIILQPNTKLKQQGFVHLQVFGKKIFVGVHIRQYEKDYFYNPPVQYFEKAINLFRSKFENVQFIVASDNTFWCKKQKFLQKKDIYILPNSNSPALDMTILSLCDHIILSMGSFGWWSAFLGPGSRNGTVLYYNRGINMDHAVNKNKIVEMDYYPSSWISFGIDKNLLNFDFCPWSSVKLVPPVSNEIAKRNAKNYNHLSKFFVENNKKGIFTGALISGSLRAFYMTGHLANDASDMDIDLSGGEYEHKAPRVLQNTIPKIYPHISWDSNNFSKYGVCECFLPGNLPFLCLRNIETYLVDTYGLSWWVPIPGMKRSIMQRQESSAGYIDPLFKILQLYMSTTGDITKESLYFLLVLEKEKNISIKIRHDISKNRDFFRSKSWAEYNDASREMNDLLVHIQDVYSKRDDKKSIKIRL